MKRYFEKLIRGDDLTLDHSVFGKISSPDYSIFWEISIVESRITERFGAAGMKGDSQTEIWQSRKEAEDRAKQLVFEKERLGYKEQNVPAEAEEQPSKFAVKRYYIKYLPAKSILVGRRIEFWELSIIGRSVAERFGIHGTRGDCKVSIWSSLQEAMDWGRLLKEEREKDGYREQAIPVRTIRRHYEDPELAPAHERFYGRVDALTEERFLHYLDEAGKGPSEGYYFNPPASQESIAALESGCQIILPKSLRSFLLRYDGGFVWRQKGTELYLAEEKKCYPEKTEIELKLSVSFPLFSTSEISASYREPGIIPVGRTENSELMAVWSMRQPHQESPVLDAFHEETACQWSRLYPSFAHLFIDYVEKQGRIYEIGS